ncbi:hypothetical protein LEMLEM_LOCUS1865, partial [Lemmus lemmus]
ERKNEGNVCAGAFVCFWQNGSRCRTLSHLSGTMSTGMLPGFPPEGQRNTPLNDPCLTAVPGGAGATACRFVYALLSYLVFLKVRRVCQIP